MEQPDGYTFIVTGATVTGPDGKTTIFITVPPVIPPEQEIPEPDQQLTLPGFE